MIGEMINAVENVKVNEAVRGYIADVAIATRTDSGIRLGLSTRGVIALKKMAQARAAVRGREHVMPEDVIEVAPYVCAHRIISRSAVVHEGADAKAEYIRKLLKDIPVPTEEL